MGIMSDRERFVRNEDWIKTLHWDLPKDPDEFIRMVLEPTDPQASLDAFMLRPAAEKMPEDLKRGLEERGLYTAMKKYNRNHDALGRFAHTGGIGAALDSLPKGVSDRLKKFGVQFEQHEQRNGEPPAHYDSGRKTIVINGDESPDKGTLIHELGHAYDHSFDWVSTTKDFQSIVPKEVRTYYAPVARQIVRAGMDTSTTKAAMREVFADAFGATYGGSTPMWWSKPGLTNLKTVMSGLQKFPIAHTPGVEWSGGMSGHKQLDTLYQDLLYGTGRFFMSESPTYQDSVDIPGGSEYTSVLVESDPATQLPKSDGVRIKIRQRIKERGGRTKFVWAEVEHHGQATRYTKLSDFDRYVQSLKEPLS